MLGIELIAKQSADCWALSQNAGEGIEPECR
jgi:hypothetical protein